MLVAGVVVERREGYRIFARGLLGGGWAALYFTVYAMHAIPDFFRAASTGPHARARGNVADLDVAGA